jgi:hypothetical protein
MRSDGPEPLLRWGGSTAILAAFAATPAWIASVVKEDPVSSWPIIAATAALLIALPAIFAGQAPRMGRLGRVGFVLMMVGGIFEVAGMTTVMIIQAKVGLHGHERFIASGSVAPHFAVLSALAVAFFLGAILFGLATSRGTVFPRRAGQMVVVGSVAMVAGSVPDITALVAGGAILQFAGFAWMGWSLDRLTAGADRSR